MPGLAGLSRQTIVDNFHAAARGKLGAQRDVAMLALHCAAQAEDDASRLEFLISAEMFARLAVANGGQEERKLLLEVLGLRIEEASANGREATKWGLGVEYVALLDRFADEGFDEASGVLSWLGEGAPAELFALAKDFRDYAEGDCSEEEGAPIAQAGVSS